MGKSFRIFIALLFLVNTFSFAQKVKIQVKKDIITANKVEVAKIVEIDEDKLLYAVEDLAGTKILEVQVNNSGSSAKLYKDNWMTVSSPNFKIINVVDYDMLGMSTDHRSIIGSALGKKYGFFSEKGFDQSKLEEFFKIQRTSENKELRTGYGGVEMKGYGQGFDGKLKIKDGIVSFDKKEIAKISEKDSLISYTSINDDTQLNVVYYNYLIEAERQNKRFSWLELSDNKGHSADIRMEYLLNFGGDTKQITTLLSKVYNVLTVNGIQNLDEFFAIERPKLSEPYNLANAQHLKSMEEMKAIIDARRPLYQLSETGEITRTIDDEYLGRIILPESLLMNKESTTVIQVGERKDKKVLELTPAGSSIFTAGFFGDDYYYFRSNNTNLSFQDNKQELRSEILNFIIAKQKDSMLNLGYEEYKEIRKIKAIERYKARKLVSPNIYASPGFLIDDDGEKWEGQISIQFEELINPEIDDSVVFKNVVEIGGGDTKYGKELQLEYVNEKGKTKKDIFKSSNEVEFHVTDANGKENVYRGIKTNIDELEAAIMAASLNFNYSSFYLIEKEDNDILLYKNPLTLAKGIKTKVNDRGLTFFSDSSEKNYLKLKKYLSDCTNLPENFKDLDYTKQESLTTILNYYNSSCK